MNSSGTPGAAGSDWIQDLPGAIPAWPVAATLAILSAVLLVLSFPKADLSPLAWICMVPWFFAVVQLKPASAFFNGLLFGIVFFGGLLYWTVPAICRYGDLSPFLAVATYLFLILYLAMFPALYALGACRVGIRSLPLFLLFLPVYWVVLEWIRSQIFTGVPWGLLGYSQYRFPLWIQSASIAGVYSVSFLVVFLNSLLAAAVFRKGKDRVFLLLASAGVLLAIPGFGSLAMPDPEIGNLRVATVQGNILQAEKWESGQEEAILDRHLRLTREAIRTGVDLIIWPESSLPFPLTPAPPSGDESRLRLETIPGLSGTGLLFGAVEYRPGGKYPAAANTAQFLSEQGFWKEPYAKVHLVPFVEYIPMKRFLFFLNRMAKGTIADFTPGKGPVLHSVGSFRFSTAICYEVVFPELIRRYTLSGAEFLVNITNDGWFGRSSGPYQHFAMAVFRAVENRRWLVRAANTGISGFIDPFGRIRRRTRIMETGISVEAISPRSDLTIYHRIGDAFPVGCGIIALGVLLFPGKVRRKNQSSGIPAISQGTGDIERRK